VLGAPEILQPFLAADAHLGTFLEEQAARGMRVLLFAWHPEPTRLQSREDEVQLPHELIPLGAVSLRDTLRPKARETLTRLADLGVQISDYFWPHHTATKGAAGTGTTQSWSLRSHDW
jgi:cation-transporting P-type ATPase E